MKGKIVVIMGSGRDLSFAERIRSFISEEGFSVKCEFNVASAHRTPDLLIEKLKRYEEEGGSIVYITIAGLSDALSGVVAGNTGYPVIACPPDPERFGWSKIFSSIMTPTGVPVMLTLKPENAALAALRILSLSDPTIHERMNEYTAKKRSEVIKADEEVRGIEQ